MTIKIKGFLMFVVVCLFAVSCKHSKDEYHSINDRIKVESENYHGTSISSEKYSDHLKTIRITENWITFSIPERKGEIKSYACTECHDKPLDKMERKDIKMAHWNIKLNHADDHIMNCITCHDGNSIDNLNSITGRKIDFNKSHKLCSQCHQKQFKDWTGGAHGKQIGGWAPPRVSNTCVNCHNPHNPYFEKRWPIRFNTQKVKERQ